jgi:hypothetical protein
VTLLSHGEVDASDRSLPALRLLRHTGHGPAVEFEVRADEARGKIGRGAIREMEGVPGLEAVSRRRAGFCCRCDFCDAATSATID